MEIIFHSHANKTHFHKRGCAPSLILKVRVFGTRKWPICLQAYELSPVPSPEVSVSHNFVPTGSYFALSLGLIIAPGRCVSGDVVRARSRNHKQEVQRLLQSWSEQRVLFFHNNILAGHTSLLQVYRCYWTYDRNHKDLYRKPLKQELFSSYKSF